VVVAGDVTTPGAGSASGDTVQAAEATATLDGIQPDLVAAADLKALPSTTPSLALASKDHPDTGKCLLEDTLNNLLPDSACTFGDVNATRTIALVGDSHANQWEPAVAAFGKANGFKVIEYAKAACPPGVYANYIDPQTNRIYTNCDNFRNQVFAHLKTVKPQYVILTAELRTLDIDPSGEIASIQKFQADDAHVIYLEDTPSALQIGLVPNCLAKNPSDIQKCAMARSASTTRLEGFIQRKTEAAAATGAGASIIDPANWFCTATTCPPVINHIVVYSDDTHITATYATWLAPLLGDALQKITG
jgi:hypothetical protein